MASSFPKMQKGSANFSQSIRNRLRLKNLQAQAKNFCRVLDIRVPQVVKGDFKISLVTKTLETLVYRLPRKRHKITLAMLPCLCALD